MRIIVDGDACPSINLITEIAKQYHIPLYIYLDTSHNIDNDYATVTTVSKGYQAVDMEIANHLLTSDILITSDYGLASLGLIKKARAIHPNGYEYTLANIDLLLSQRYFNYKCRKQNIKVQHQKKRTQQNGQNLKMILIKFIEEKN